MARRKATREKGFTVQDRRRFSPETGEAREEATDSPNETTEAAKPTESPAAPASETPQEPLPDINFSTFVISLSTQARCISARSPSINGKIDPDVPAAKRMIDMLP
jgi:hypothetical protein